MIHEKGLNIGQRHITVSTSGIVPNIYQFADENTQINLAISIHAPNDELRSKLMPVNRRFPFRGSDGGLPLLYCEDRPAHHL